MSQKKVFISSTYKDLQQLRLDVAKLFQDLFFTVVRMENFPSDADTPEENSIKWLQDCDYYVLILGHKYGTIPKGWEISITHKEYLEAVKKKERKELINIFIFIATDDFRLRQSDIELVENRQKLIDFKSKIKESYRTFSSKDELLKAINETIHHQSNTSNPNGKFKIFYNLTEVESILDSSIEETKLSRIDKAMADITKSFNPLFKLEYNADLPTDQPILRALKKTLNESIPNIVFDKSNDFKGQIDRWGIRHVIFRAETVIELMKSITNTKLLLNIGVGIGRNASKDLFEKVIIPNSGKHLIPGSIGAFVQLLNYWDSSGGWGELSYREENNPKENNDRWILITENNFLSGNETNKDVNHLYAFWQGYIKGALDMAIEKLSAIYSSLPFELKKQFSFPPYLKIISVERELDENQKNIDFFKISFEEHPYRYALELITDIRIRFLSGDKDDITNRGIFAELGGLLNTLKRDDTNLFEETFSKFLNDDKKKLKIIIEHDRRSYDQIDLLQCIGLANQFIQSFLNL